MLVPCPTKTQQLRPFFEKQVLRVHKNPQLNDLLTNSFDFNENHWSQSETINNHRN